MPSTSKTQQRLMGAAYSVKKGDTQLSDIDPDYRDKVKDLVDGMTLNQLKDFAETSHEGLPEVKEQITPNSIGGMGPVSFPTDSTLGSGDVPAHKGKAKKIYKNKKMRHLNTFESFLEGKGKKINEEYIELGQLMDPADEMIEAFKEWYNDTASNWEDFKEDMSEESVDEAAKNAQIEILEYLVDGMNKIIKDRKFKVTANFK